MTEEHQIEQVVIDFNKAFNIPSTYELLATCGLPLKDKHLPIYIEIGGNNTQTTTNQPEYLLHSQIMIRITRHLFTNKLLHSRKVLLSQDIHNSLLCLKDSTHQLNRK